MIQLPRLTFTGKDGRKYVFTVYPKDHSFDNQYGLYSFLAHRQDGYHVLYIGQTINFSDRLRPTHHKWDEASTLGFNCLAVCTDGVSLLSLDDDEKNLIQAYRPVCNEELLR